MEIVCKGRQKGQSMNMDFWKAALIRAFRTFLQVILAVWTAGQLITEVDWKFLLMSAFSSAVYSLLTSILAGLPEVQIEPLQNEFNEDDIEEIFEVEADDYENEIDTAEE